MMRQFFKVQFPYKRQKPHKQTLWQKNFSTNPSFASSFSFNMPSFSLFILGIDREICYCLMQFLLWYPIRFEMHFFLIKNENRTVFLFHLEMIQWRMWFTFSKNLRLIFEEEEEKTSKVAIIILQKCLWWEHFSENHSLQ